MICWNRSKKSSTNNAGLSSDWKDAGTSDGGRANSSRPRVSLAKRLQARVLLALWGWYNSFGHTLDPKVPAMRLFGVPSRPTWADPSMLIRMIEVDNRARHVEGQNRPVRMICGWRMVVLAVLIKRWIPYSPEFSPANRFTYINIENTTKYKG